MLELAGFSVEPGLVANPPAAGRAPDLVVLADDFPDFDSWARHMSSGPGRTGNTKRTGFGAVVLGSAQVTILLVRGASGFAPGWPARYGVDRIVVVRGPVGAAPMWGTRLAQIIEAEWPAAAEALAPVHEGGRGFDALVHPVVHPKGDRARRKTCLRYAAAAFGPEQIIPLLEQLVRRDSARAAAAGPSDLDDSAEHSAGHPAEDPVEIHRIALELAVELGPVGFSLLAEVAESLASPPSLRVRAIDALVRRAPAPFVATVAKGVLAAGSTASVADAAAEALMAAGRDLGPDGLDDLVAVAEAPTVDGRVRAAAAEAVAALFAGQRVQGILTAWQNSDDFVLRAASTGPAARAREAEAWATVVEDGSRPMRERVAALVCMAPRAPYDWLEPALSVALEDEGDLRGTAIEWWLRRADLDPSPVWAALEEQPQWQARALFGALMAGRAGWRGLEPLVRHAQPAVRADALRVAALRFDPGQTLPLVREALAAGGPVGRAAVTAALLTGSAGHAVLAEAVRTAADPDIRVEALEQIVRHAAFDVVDAALRRALRSTDASVQQAALRHALARADDALPAWLDRVVEARRPDLADAAVEGLVAAGPGGFAGLVAIARHAQWPVDARRRAVAQLWAWHPDDVPTDLPTVAAVPAGRAVPWDAADTAPMRPAAGPNSQRRDVRSAPAANRSAPSRTVDQYRRSLQGALQRGRAGFRALRTLAALPSVPDEVRIQALRHLAADFPEADVVPVLERALIEGSPDVRGAALGALMVRSDARAPAVSAIARDPSAPAGLRMRAGRFLASRWPKRAVAADLEVLLDADESGVRRVALEGLFPSMHYTPDDQVEERLINILEAHQSADVRASAALALGAFGRRAAARALSAVDLRGAPERLRAAIRSGLDRIRSRLERA